MKIRHAEFDDLQYLLPMARKAHKASMFGEIEMNETVMQRNFVLAINYDDGFGKVAEHNGKVVGGLVGLIIENHYGIRCAQDIFNSSKYGTDLLIRNFLVWARVRGARFVQITDLTNNSQYEKLCRSLKMELSGKSYAKVM